MLDWTAGTASALDSAQIAKGRDVGAVRVRDVATGADGCMMWCLRLFSTLSILMGSGWWNDEL